MQLFLQINIQHLVLYKTSVNFTGNAQEKALIPSDRGASKN